MQRVPATAGVQTGTPCDALALYPWSRSVSWGVWLMAKETEISAGLWAFTLNLRIRTSAMHVRPVSATHDHPPTRYTRAENYLMIEWLPSSVPSEHDEAAHSINTIQ